MKNVDLEDLRLWHGGVVAAIIVGLYVLSVVIDRKAPARAIRRAMASRKTVHVRMRVTDVEGTSHRAQLQLEVEGTDRAKLTTAMPKNADLQDLFEALLTEVASTAVSTVLKRDGGHFTDVSLEGLRAELTVSLATVGVQLHHIDIAASLKLDHATQELDGWLMSAASQHGSYVSDLSLLDFYLDGLAGGGSFKASCFDSDENRHSVLNSVSFAQNTTRYQADVVDRAQRKMDTISLAYFQQKPFRLGRLNATADKERDVA